MVHAEVVKSGNETALAVLRKFSRKIQGTGLIKGARARRYYSRTLSKTVSKKKALKRIKRTTDYQRQIKEGKIAEVAPRRGYGARPGAPRDTNTSTQPQVPSSASAARFGEDTPIAR